MKDKAEDHNTQNYKELFKQFAPEEIKGVRKIWEKSAKATPNHYYISKKEIEEALSKVNRRIDAKQASLKPKKERKTYLSTWKWSIAAAVIFVMAAAAWLLIPRTVSVPYGTTKTVVLPDGSSVQLNSGSELQYNRLYSYTNRDLNLSGEAFFSVRHGAYPFIIKANGATIQVTGTRFNVRSWAGGPTAAIEVSVLEGTVTFYGDTPQSFVKIKAGQQSSLADNAKKPSAPRPVNINHILSWRNHKLFFNNRTLEVIFRELERRFDININLENPQIGRQKLTAFYTNPSDAESVLKDICRVEGLHYAKTAHGFKVMRDY